MVKRQDRPHRKPTHHNPVAGLTQAIFELLCATAMPSELWYMHSMTGTGEPLGDESHLHRRSAESVDQQEACWTSNKSDALISNLCCLRARLLWQSGDLG